MENQTRLTFNVNPEIKKQAKMKALKKGITLTEYLTDLVLRDIEND